MSLEVVDDGRGASADALASASAYGVMGMRERAAHFAGELFIDSAPGRGTALRLVMPLARTKTTASLEVTPT